MTIQTSNGLIAKELLDLQLPLQVLKSNAGFYIGTFIDADENITDNPDYFGPITRESEEYFSTAEEAKNALEKGLWTQKTEL